MRQANFTRWLLVALSVFLLTVLGGAYVAYRALPQIYTANALIQVSRPGPAPLPAFSGPTSGPDPKELFQSEMTTIGSPDILLPVIQYLHLDQVWARRLLITKKPFPAVEAMAYLQKRLRIENVPGTHLIRITVASDLPQEAADIANAIADQYKALRDLQQVEKAAIADKALLQQIADQQKVVDDLKVTVDKLAKDSSASGVQIAPATDHQPSPGLSPYLQRYRDAIRQLEREQLILDSLKIRLKQINVDLPLLDSPVTIISRAAPPTTPSSPNKLAALIVSIIVGLFSGVSVATLLESVPGPPSGSFLKSPFLTSVIFMVAFIAGGTFTYFLLPRVYTTTAQLQIQEYPPPVSPEKIDLPFDVEKIQSDESLLFALSVLNRDHSWAKRVFHSSTVPDAQALAFWRKNLRIEIDPATNRIAITVSSVVPQEATALANLLADRHVLQCSMDEFHHPTFHDPVLEAKIAAQQKTLDAMKLIVDQLKLKMETSLNFNMPNSDNDPLHQDLRHAQANLNIQREALTTLIRERVIAASEYPLRNHTARVTSPAEIPSSPSYPSTILTLALSLAAGLFLGTLALLAKLLLSKRDRRAS